jgi:hypothetical protein
MSGRIGAVTLLALLFTASSLWAHALEARFLLLPDKKVKIEAWFETDDPANNAKVEVFGPDQKLLVNGKTDADGFFTFSLTSLEPLEVKINAGGGHGKILAISADDLSKPTADPGRPQYGSVKPESKGDVGDGVVAFPVREVILGVSFLLAVAAFAISIHNAQAIKKLKGQQQV